MPFLVRFHTFFCDLYIPDTFPGHQYTYTRCDILHWDISMGNIIIVDWKLLRAVNDEPEPKLGGPKPHPPWLTPEVELGDDLQHIEGLLIDWDLALKRGMSVGRQCERVVSFLDLLFILLSDCT